MTLSIIVAMAENRIIGKDNRLPWHLPEDLKHFKEITMGKPVIMGRKTYESIGRPLPGRENIVLTRNKSYQAKGAKVISSLQEAIKACPSAEEIFIIGGAELYKETLSKADRLYLTVIHKDFEGDAYFPKVDLEKDFKVVEKTDCVSSGPEKLSYTFITAERIPSN